MLPDFDRADRIGDFWGYRRAAPSPIPLEANRESSAELRGKLADSEVPQLFTPYEVVECRLGRQARRVTPARYGGVHLLASTDGVPRGMAGRA
jgi:hypothetical protein